MMNLARPGAVRAILNGLRPPRVYQGRRTDDGVEVWADERQVTPVLSLLVWNHSPDGFEWGYGGSGPAQLALAVLLDVGLRADLARHLHQDFKWAMVALWSREESWTLQGQDLVTWIGAALAELAQVHRDNHVGGGEDA
jgi:hypothetical protein